MHTHMDTHDLLLTAEESLTDIARTIESLAKDSVYAYVEDGTFQVQFQDESRILARGDADTGELILDAPNHHFRFAWDDVEEEWLSTEGGYPIRTVLEKLITEHIGETVSLAVE